MKKQNLFHKYSDESIFEDKATRSTKLISKGEKNHMIISIDAKKLFDKINTHLWLKKKKCGNEIREEPPRTDKNCQQKVHDSPYT